MGQPNSEQDEKGAEAGISRDFQDLGDMSAKMSFWHWLAMVGPGLLVMLADTDSGNVVAAADTGTRWGYRLALLPLLLVPMLAMVQDLAVRIGIFTGQGYASLVQQRFGRSLRMLAGFALVAATFGSLMTEMTGIVGVGELFGVSRFVALPLIGVTLMAVFMTGEYRRVERIAILIGLFELAFLIIVIRLHPSLVTFGKEILDQKITNPGYLYSAAAIIGATFNPWMIFYQASAVSELKMDRRDYKGAKLDTWMGAILTQLLTTAILVAAAAVFRNESGEGALTEVGQISRILEPVLGSGYARIVFGLGVVGASLAAAIVVLLASVWGISELIGRRTSLLKAGRSPVYLLAVLAAIVAAGFAVLQSDDLVWLTVALQVANAVLMPFVVLLLVILAATALPAENRLKGGALWALAFMAVIVSLTGLTGVWSAFN